MKIWTRFTNWMRGISPEVLDFAYPVLRSLTPLLIEIARQEVSAAEAYTTDNGEEKFKKAQAGVRASLKAAKVTVTNGLINAAIELAVAALPRK
jgi:hypothetical protein